jgi:hypothetical protein
MEVLEEAIKSHNINIESSSSNCYSHGNALSTYGFSFNATSTSSFDEWLIDYGASYHMGKDKTVFCSFNEFNTKQIFVSDDKSLNVVRY